MENCFIKMTYRSYPFTNNFLFAFLKVVFVILLITLPGTQLCLFYILIGQTSPRQNRSAKGIYLLKLRSEMVIILTYIYIFDAILEHSFFVIFFDTKYFITNRRKNTQKGKCFVSIEYRVCGIWL